MRCVGDAYIICFTSYHNVQQHFLDRSSSIVQIDA